MIKILCFALLFATSSTVFGQWRDSAFGETDAKERAVFCDFFEQESFIVLGHSTAIDSFTKANVWIYDFNFNLQNNWKISTNSNLYVNGGLVQNGFAYLLGESLKTNGLKQAFLVTFDLLTNNYTIAYYSPPNQSAVFYYPAILEDGSILAAGYQSNPSGNGNDALLVKFNANSQFVWQQTYGRSNLNEVAYRCLNIDARQIMLVGDAEQLNGNYNVYLLKLDSVGSVLLEKNIAVTQNSGSKNMLATSDGDFLITGELFDTAGNGFDHWIVLINDQGDEIWKQHYSLANGDHSYAATELSDGSFTCTGFMYDVSNNETDVALLEVSSSGSIMNTQHFGTGLLDVGTFINSNTQDELIICGYSNKNSDEQLFLATNAQLVSEIPTIDGTDQLIAPNLFSRSSPQRISTAEISFIRFWSIYDIQGKEIKRIFPENVEFKLNEAGIYWLVQHQNNGHKLSQKIVVY